MTRPPITPADVQDARQLLVSVRQREAQRESVHDALRRAKTATEQWQAYLAKRFASPRHPDIFQGMDRLYKQAPPQVRARIVREYRFFLKEMIDPLKPFEGPARKPLSVDFAAMPLFVRPYFVGPYLGIQQNTRFAELDFEHSDAFRRLVIVQSGGPMDVDQWRSKLSALNDWLNGGIFPGKFTITAHTASTVTLTRQKSLPDVIPFERTHLRKGALFVGIDAVHQTPVYIDFAELTAGTYIPGSSGSGKTSALHVLLRSIFANLDLFDEVHLVDGKDGVAMARYSKLHSKVQVHYDEPDVWALAARLTTLMRERNAEQRARGVDKATEGFIALVIDELPTFVAPPGKGQKEEHAAFLENLQKIAMRGRSAGLRMFMISQSPVKEQVPVSLRSNCATTLAFRLPENSHANAIFGELNATNDPRKLPTGQAILLESDKGRITTVQVPFAPLYNPPRRGA